MMLQLMTSMCVTELTCIAQIMIFISVSFPISSAEEICGCIPSVLSRRVTYSLRTSGYTITCGGRNSFGNRNVMCETKIGRLEYYGKKKSFNWEKYTNLHVEQYNIKDTLTAHGFNYWSEAQKVRYLVKRIQINLVNTCPANISGSAALHDDLAAVARHVPDFLIIINFRDPCSNRNISGVDTDRDGGGGRGHIGGPGRGIRGGGVGHSHG